jgi:hypothetical protein
MSEKLTEEYIACWPIFQRRIFKNFYVRLRPDMPVQAQRGGRGIAPPNHNLSTRKAWCGQHHAPAVSDQCHALATLSPGRNPSTHQTGS